MAHFYTSPPKIPGYFLWGYLMGPHQPPKGRARGPGATPSRLKGRPAAGSKAWEGFPGCHPGVTSPLPGKMKECFCCVFPSKWGSVPVIFVGGYEHVIFLLERKWKWNHPSNFQPSILIRYLRCYICLNLTAR